MKKMRFNVMHLLLIAVVVLSSCSKSSQIARFIPENATVISIDVKQIFEKSKLGDNEAAKKELLRTIKENADNKKAKDLFLEIVDNPAKAGVDLREPIFCFVDKEEEEEAIVGTILDKDDFAEMMNALAEDSSEEVKEKDGIMYQQRGGYTIAFDDATFYISQNREIREIVKIFKNDDTHKTMAESDDFAKLLDGNGLIKVLIPMAALDEAADASIKRNLPKGAKIRDLSILMNITSGKGNITLSTEVLTKSDVWKDYFKKSADISGKIDGDYLKYLKKGNFMLYANIDGEDLYEMLSEKDVFEQAGLESQKSLVKKVLQAIDGDIAINVSDFNTPEIVAYIKTKDNTLVDMAEESGVALPSFDFGFKNGTTYVSYGTDAFKEPRNTYDNSSVKGHRVYLYCDAKLMLNLSAPYGYRRATTQARKLAEYVDAFELYDTGTTSCNFVLKLKDEDKDPIELLGELIMDNL